MSDTATDLIRIAFTWRHGRGGYADYFAALARGQALASRDRASGRVSFPPRLDGTAEPVLLAGTGTLRALTRGPAVLPLREGTIDACFALVAMDGAHNLSFGRVLEPPADLAVGARVRLALAPGAAAHPSQAACYVAEPRTGEQGDDR